LYVAESSAREGKSFIDLDGQDFIESGAGAVPFDFDVLAERAELAICRLNLGVCQIAYKIGDDLLAAGYGDSGT